MAETHRTGDHLTNGSGPQLTDESTLTKVLVRAATDTPAAQQLAVRIGTSRTEGQVLILAIWLIVYSFIFLYLFFVG